LQTHFILYVRDQARARDFYQCVLGLSPQLDVAGMTEFALSSGATLGLMPEENIKRLLVDALPDPALAHGVPRAELYLLVAEPQAFHVRAIGAGARELSPLQLRTWGHVVAYSLDLDGHVLAFASAQASPSMG
jgi:uncharacterized protein